MALTKVRGAGAEGLTLSSTALTIANGLTLTDGNVTLASGHGIDFSATSDGTTMTGELLDDYEEGTFTASMSNSVTLDSSYNSLGYTRIGRSVTVGGQLRMSSSTPGNNVIVNNLPFTSRANDPSGQTSQGYHWSCARIYQYDVPSGTIDVGCYQEPNTTVLGFQTSHDNAVSQVLTAWQNGWLMFTITYFAA
mgnify:CR=1 FL=1|tara:strand:- start:309 stop:887 length:579 start_codon:yes stop_codon:yes gene_type:complete